MKKLLFLLIVPFLSFGQEGCMDENACNYDSNSTIDNGTCSFSYNSSINLITGNWIVYEDNLCDGQVSITWTVDYDSDGNYLYGSEADNMFQTGVWSLCDDYYIDLGSWAIPNDTVPSWFYSGNVNPDGSISGTTQNSSGCTYGCFVMYPEGSSSIQGCTDSAACNYFSFATIDNGTCEYSLDCGGFGLLGPLEPCTIIGCSDALACNYNATAIEDDGACEYPEPYYDCNNNCLNDLDSDDVCDELEIGGCLETMACNYNPNATETTYCDYSCYCDTVFITDTIVETEYIDVVITEYIDCDSGLPCESGMGEIIEKSKIDGKIYNLLGQEILRREGIYIEGGEIKYRLQ
jgi:hypothetical protein